MADARKKRRDRYAPALRGERLRAARLARDMSQLDLMVASGVYTNALSQMEANKKDTLGAYIVRIADALNISTDYLFGRSDFMELPQVRIAALEAALAEKEARIRELERLVARQAPARKKGKNT